MLVTLPNGNYAMPKLRYSNSFLEKFLGVGVAFTSDGRQGNELDTRIGKDCAVIRALRYSVIIKRELSKKAKLLIFKTAIVPILTHAHESWVITKRVRSQVQAFKMRFLQRIEGVTLFHKVHSSEIQKSLDIEPLHFSELKDIRLDDLAMYAECLMKNSPNKLYLPKQMGKDQQLDDIDYKMNQLH